MRQMTQCGCREELLHYIDSLSLVLYDVALFLNTHPCDEDALQLFHHFKQLLKEARKDYAENYGPLGHMDVDSCNYWTWINEPWPWE